MPPGMTGRRTGGYEAVPPATTPEAPRLPAPRSTLL
nr:MAG TPA: hypothetical protein [Caudoviricetes sp.]